MYSDVKRFYYEKYGKTIGALRFKLYLARKQKSKKQKETMIKKTRINLFVF